jgi:hypothetical protein
VEIRSPGGSHFIYLKEQTVGNTIFFPQNYTYLWQV